MHTAADFWQERLELDELLKSGIFNRAPNLALMLRYVCTQYFEGTAEQIKEYNIAVEALGRPADFDQKRDSIVRVEAHRLRKRLREYYETDGANHTIRIEIPSGQYAPCFLRTDTAAIPATPPAAQPSPAPAEVSNGEQDTQVALPIPPSVETASPVTPEERHLATIPSSTGDVFLHDKAARPIPYTRNMVLGALFIATIGAGTTLWHRSETKGATVPPNQFVASPGPSPNEIRILAGHQNGDYTDRLGRLWQRDRYYQGGSVFEFTDHAILGTREPRIYQSRREGAFSYDIPLPPGIYELRLHFAETLYGENNVAGGGEASRVFNVSINDQPVLSEFDVLAEAGPSTADVRAFKNIAPSDDGKLHLKFTPTNAPALLSAIEISPGTPGKLLPIRLISTDRLYVDKQGRAWEPDRYVRGGQLVARTAPVDGPADPELFRSERYGNLRYVIPVPPGHYGVTFYFAEAWFGPGTPAGGGPGSRIFNILCNGVMLRRGFDIFKEAHGGGRSVIWTVHNLEPDAQGKLNIALTPLRNYAALNALEVIDESL